jgi:hypothetical protein
MSAAASVMTGFMSIACTETENWIREARTQEMAGNFILFLFLFS